MTDPSFFNIDKEDVYKSCLESISEITAQNCFVRFNKEGASCALNLKANQINTLINVPDNEGQKYCRWLNLWGWSADHVQAIATIAKRYEVPPRLAGLMCPHEIVTPSENVGSSGALAERDSDTEKALNVRHLGGNQNDGDTGMLKTFRDIVQDLWHFCSVDPNRRYLCLGFNAMFNIPDLKPDLQSTKPRAQRVWSIIMICDDGLVVSVFESPKGLSPKALKIIRNNQLNVFCHLSKVEATVPGLPLPAVMQVHIRALQDGANKPFDAWEAASLLFYYLFDDWVITYGLISQRQHPYRQMLEKLRHDMLERADLQLLNSLHILGKQLNTLKLVYRSYELIVSRILQRQKLLASFTSSNYTSKGGVVISDPHAFTYDSSQETPFLGQPDNANVRLATPAVVRFERLLDRIRLYALTEIEECISEKESLVLMNFNYVALKESQAVEKLTRITVLLAKATIMFLPVSLLTGYFSMQMPQIAELYSLKTYWLSFLVVVLLTFGILFVFGLASGTLEGKIVYKSLTRTIWDLGSSRRRRKAEATNPDDALYNKLNVNF